MSLPGVINASKKRARSDLILLLVSLIWGSAFVAQRVAAQQMDAFLFNGTRFLVGALVLLPLAVRNPGKPKRVDIPGIALAGSLLFGGAALQQIGMQTTTAANGGFITGLYVVFIPLLLALFWRQSPQPRIWLAAFLAVAGLFLLSTGGRLALATGDVLVLLGAILWALHVIVIGLLVRRMEVIHLATGQYLVCSLLNLLLFTVIGQKTLVDGLSGAWWAVVYTGVFSIAIGYTLQGYGQKEAPPADAAIILSMEAVFAALFGWVLLEEHLSAIQILGCALMATGMMLSQISIFRANSPRLHRDEQHQQT
jgi:drug/metabolite transporter (DMT)-like permease